jgi:Rad3-related DNA helicase
MGTQNKADMLAQTREQRVVEAFSAPSFREKQKEVTVQLVTLLEDDETDVILLNAPTGSGKSLVIEGAARATSGTSFVTTPLNALVDQIDNDDFIDEGVITLKGRNNYECIHPEDEGTPVDEAICQRDSDFDCELKGKCPYYGRKKNALDTEVVVTNLPYLMAEGMIPNAVQDTLGDRQKLFVDECQNISSFARNFVQFTVSPRSVPDAVWNNISLPPERHLDDMDRLVRWVKDDLLDAVAAEMQRFERMPFLSKEQSSEYEDLRQFKLRVDSFVDDVSDNEWVADMDKVIRKNAPNSSKVVFEPLFVGRFLDDLLWGRGDTIVLSSATIPGGNWLEEIGLGDKTVREISVGSTFPVDNRPVVCNLDVGKMVSEYSDDEDNREMNKWDMAKRIMELAHHHDGEQGFVHCRSYKIMKMLSRQYRNHGTVELNGEAIDAGRWFNENVQLQDRYNREESLEEWFENDKQVFFSVAMDEGIDLKGDVCRWQVLAKTLYPFMSKRMKRRKEYHYERDEGGKFWDYYNRQAVVQIQQAYGRGVRSKDDECVFYVLDSSAVQNQGLIQMNAEMFCEWFLEAIEGMNVRSGRGR